MIGETAPSRKGQYLVEVLRGDRPSEHSPHAFQNPTIYVPGLQDAPWHEWSRFPWVQELENLAPAILSEFEALQSDGGAFQPYREPGEDGGPDELLHENGEWNIAFLYFEGKRFSRNCGLAPTTTAFFESLPRRAGLACFSRLSPNAHILPHCAPSNVALRCHLGLIVPPDARMRVGNEVRRWGAGKCSIFDHSFEHEVWGSNTWNRVVLIVDFFHPDLSEDDVTDIRAALASPTFATENEPWLKLFGAD